jgi:UDP-N-acetylmuramoyl-tripeptide--D-alanyl-D-alanine ligase
MATKIPDNAAAFTLDEVASAVAGTLVSGEPSREVVGVIIDSRRVKAGSLFVAIRGGAHDAARFLPDVVSAGAAAVLVHPGTSVPAGVAVIEVADTTRALGDLARHHRRRWGRTLVAITGSAGKTTTKELTALAFRSLGRRVLATTGNLNNQIGVPMTLFELTAEHDLAVLEEGTSARGEIARLGAISEPSIAMVLLAAAAHTEGIGDVDAVADEKASLFHALSPDGVQLVNADDARLLVRLRSDVAALRFGHAAGVDVRLASATVGARGTRVEIACGAETHSAELPIFGEALALDAAGALSAVIAVEGVAALGPALDSLRSFRAAPGRMALVETQRGPLIIDDTYNANPSSVISSLGTLVALAQARGGRSVAVLGDMKELGQVSLAEHARIGEHAVRAGVSVLVGCGPEMAHATSAAARLASGRLAVHPTRVAHVVDPREAVRVVGSMIGPGDAVLVKGSRSMEMERVVEALVSASGGVAAPGGRP